MGRIYENGSLYADVLRHAAALEQEVRERKRAAERITAQHAITRVLAESSSVLDAGSQILEAVCTSLDWDLGSLWQLDPATRMMRCVRTWHTGTPALARFEAESKREPYGPGTGLPGTVLVARKAIQYADYARDTHFPRTPLAARIGLHGAFGFPIILGDDFLGVFEFFSTQVKEVDQDLLETMTTIGSQIGQFIERQQAKDAAAQRAQLAELEAEIGVILTRGGALPLTLRACAEVIVRRLDAAFVRIWTLNAEQDVLEMVASEGMYTHLDGPHSRVTLGQLKIGRIAAESETSFDQ